MILRVTGKQTRSLMGKAAGLEGLKHWTSGDGSVEWLGRVRLVGLLEQRAVGRRWRSRKAKVIFWMCMISRSSQASVIRLQRSRIFIALLRVSAVIAFERAASWCRRQKTAKCFRSSIATTATITIARTIFILV